MLHLSKGVEFCSCNSYEGLHEREDDDHCMVKTARRVFASLTNPARLAAPCARRSLVAGSRVANNRLF